MTVFLRHIRNFTGQFRRYLTMIGVMVKSIYTLKPKKSIEILVFSIAGSSLQGFCLGTIFFALRHLDKRLYVNVQKIVPFLDLKIHATLVVTGVLTLFGIAVYLLYRAERSAVETSKMFASSCCAGLVVSYPAATGRLNNLTVNPENGIPIGFRTELSNQSGKLEIASRRLLKSPMALIQAIYGVAFLLYLEPWLSLILLVVSVPFLIPLKRLTMAVREAEKRRAEATKNSQEDIKTLVNESSQILTLPGRIDPRIQKMFEKTGYDASNRHRSERITALAGSRAVATVTMVATGMVSMVYFWFFYSGEKAQLALIVVYFGALRMLVMSGRKLVARLAGFARFYVPVQKLLLDMDVADREKDTKGKLKLLGVKGLDMVRTSETEITIEGKGPFAILGSFDLLPINRYAVTFAIAKINDRKRADVITQMTVVTKELRLDMNMTWRQILGMDMTMDGNPLMEKLNGNCRVLDPTVIARNLDAPLKKDRKQEFFSKKETIELLILRAHFTGSPLVVFTEEVLDLMGAGAVDYVKTLLTDRMLFIYYHFNGQEIGRWGESSAAMIKPDPAESVGLAPVEWINTNKEKVQQWIEGDRGTGTSPWDDHDWDDDDDDDE